MNSAHNESLHWIFTPLRYVKTSEFNRSPRLRRGECRVELCSPDLSTPPQAARTSHFVPVIQAILQLNSALAEKITILEVVR